MSKSISFWMAHFPPSVYPALGRDIETDVCIVGGGISGLTCAYLLAKKGKRVVLLDATTKEKQTLRTTGHLVNVLDERYLNLEKTFGVVGSKKIAESHAAAINLIESICIEESIECDFERVEAFLFESSKPPKDNLHNELEAASRAEISVSFVDRAPLPFDTGACLCFPSQAQFNPVLYIEGLSNAIKKYGGEVYSDTSVEDINNTKVTTSTGFHVSASSLVIATNTPINDRFIIHTKQASYRTYAIAGKIPNDALHKGLYYDTEDPYHYVRIAKNLNGESFLIVGGEDHRTGENSDPESSYTILKEWTQKRFPFFTELSNCWSGQILEPVDSLAFIGINPLDKNVYIATGYSGNGLTHGTLGALLITRLIMREESPWEELYDPARKPLHSLGSFLEENLNTLLQYKDWVIPSPKDVEVFPGEGAVIQKGIKKIAVFCDENNVRHYFSATCPHLRGVVRWNPAEKTWDCPCHGSRFNAMGKAIHGPANNDLTPDCVPNP